MKLTAQIEIFSRVSFLDKMLFTKHLSMLIKSGITIIESLDILEKQAKSASFKKIISSIAESIRNGNTLAKSISKYPKIFNTLYVNLIQVGEESGKLDENLRYLADQLSKEYAFRRKVQGALMYPVIVFIAAISVGMGVSLFVLPKLIDLFKGIDIQLPITTQILLGFAGIMRDFGILIFIVLIILGFLINFLMKWQKTKPFFDSLIFKIPIFGQIELDAYLALLCRNIGIMIQSGLPVTTALDIEYNTSTNAIFKEYVKNILAAVTKGKSISEELDKKNYKLIPIIAIKMIGVGEKTGKIDETFLYLGDFFEDAVDDETKNLSTTLEPIMLLVIGLIVAFVALSVISPIYSLTTSISR